MEISSTMDLGQLSEYMGNVATIDDARAMRDLLISRDYNLSEISDIPESAWLSMLDEACRLAARTYTIAMADSGLLIATVPDGGDIEAAVRDEARLANVEFDDYTTIEGLTLTDSPADDDEIVYSGSTMGWLTDEAGRSYDYAVRRQA